MSKRRIYLALAWLCAVLLLCFLWPRARLIGTGEILALAVAIDHTIIAPIDAPVLSIVQVGNRVEAGQEIMRLSCLDLDTAIAAAQAERSQLLIMQEEETTALRAEALRIAKDWEARSQSIRAKAGEVSVKEAELQGKLAVVTAQLPNLAEQITVLEKAANAGLGRDERLADLRSERDRLTAEASALPTVIKALAGQRQQLLDDVAAWGDHRPATQLASPSRVRIRLGEIDRELLSLNATRLTRSATAVEPGIVISSLAKPGDRVRQGTPLLVLRAPSPTHAEGYIPSQATMSRIGMQVQFTSLDRPEERGYGRITSELPGYIAMPASLANNPGMPATRRVIISFDPGHPFLPGERLRVVVVP